jgi:hypothetical protein
MADTSTFERLLAYAYNETGLLESDRIQRQIDGDPMVKEEYSQLIGVLESMNIGNPIVPDRCIKAILAQA